MNWMLHSLSAGIIATCGPLLMVESIPAARRSPGLAGERRRLRSATGAGLLLFALWLVVDRTAMSAGARSLPVAAASALLFVAIFTAVGYPLLQRAAQNPEAQAESTTPTIPFLRATLDIPALALLLVAAGGFVISPNDLGYRMKGAGIIAAGVAAYFLDRPRAPRTLMVCVIAGGITLFAQWQVPWQRTVGAVWQLAVGVLGFALCARVLFHSAARTAHGSESRK